MFVCVFEKERERNHSLSLRKKLVRVKIYVFFRIHLIRSHQTGGECGQISTSLCFLVFIKKRLERKRKTRHKKVPEKDNSVPRFSSV